MRAYHVAMAGIGNDLIREARRRVGLTQHDLAERAGTTQSAISRIEAGHVAPSLDVVLRLLRLCGLDLDIMLVERDGSDLAQARRLLDLTVQERLDRADLLAREFRRLREAHQEQHGAV